MSIITTAAALSAAIQAGVSEIELDLAHPAALSGVKRPLKITGRIDLGAGLADWTAALTLSGCEGVTLDGMKIVGEPKTAGGFIGRGVVIQGGADNTVKGCDISQFVQGALLIGSSRTAFVGNDIHDIQADGIQFQQVIDLLIAENWFRRFFPTAGVHADCAQGMSNAQATDDCDGVTIRGNLMDVFPQDEVQGIFVMDPRFGGHRRILVEDNLGFSMSWWGIGVNGCKDPVVRRNRLFQLIGAPYVPRINTGGVPATLEGNEAPEYVFKTYGDPLPAGNTINKPIDAAAFDALRTAWLAKYRPVAQPEPSPTPPPPVDTELLDRVQKARKEVNDLKNGAARAVYALDKLIEEMS